MNTRFHESTKAKYFDLAFVSVIFILGVVSFFHDAFFLGVVFTLAGGIGVPWCVLRIKGEAFFIELNEEGIIIPYKETAFSIKWQKATLSWKEIKSARIKEGFPTNGYVKSYLVILLKNEVKREFLLPILRIEEDALEDIINEHIGHYNS